MFRTVDMTDQTVPLQERLFDEIKRRIVTCELLPGVELSETTVANEYGLSKAPVRSAMTRLREAGWLQSLPRRSHIVTPLSIRDVNEIYDARCLVEPETARLAAGKVSKTYLTVLNGACRQAYDLEDSDAKRNFLLANAAFHIGIARACGNERLALMLAQLHEQSLRLLYLSVSVAQRSQSWKNGHDTIINKLLNGDQAGAAKETLEGVERSRGAVMDALTRHKHLLKY